MKRLIVAVVALVAVFALSSASVYAVEGLSAGAKAGLNIATLYGSDVEDAKMKIGAAFGGFVNYSINDNIAVQPELLFSMKGAKSEFEEEILGVKFSMKETMKLSYLEIPILAKVSIPMEGKVKPVLLIGPSLGILLSAKDKIEMEAAGVSASAEVDIKEIIKPIDFGLVFGGGVDVAELGPGNLTVDARYTLGLTSIDDSGLDLSMKNGVISVMAGYSFPL